ncbi:MAG TPA: hypothetical protein VMH86_04815 [Rhizomicrobium sp.]|nr:hypothetical protein [Rhizomicrobium sp.]
MPSLNPGVDLAPYGSVDDTPRFSWLASPSYSIFPHKDTVRLVSQIQLCRILAQGKVVVPNAFFTNQQQQESAIKIATANLEGWFIDVLANTYLPFYQASWLAVAAGNLRAMPPRAANLNAYVQTLMGWNEEALEVYWPGPPVPGNFVSQWPTDILLKDTPQIAQQMTINNTNYRRSDIAYQFKTFTSALMTDDSYAHFEGLEWSYQMVNAPYYQYHRVIANGATDPDLQTCLQAFQAPGYSNNG